MMDCKKEVAGYCLKDLPEGPVARLAEVAREAAADGMVLLENSRGTLPLSAGDTVSVFGRGQTEYCKSGTGSGGMVNAPYVTNITDSLKEDGTVQVNETLETQYREWLKEHPFDIGEGWAMEPWNQEEMSVTEETAKQAAETRFFCMAHSTFA